MLRGNPQAQNISLEMRDNSIDFIKIDPSNFIQIDSGFSDLANSRKVRKINGNTTIKLRNSYYNGNNLIYYFTNPWDNDIPVILFFKLI